MMNNQPLWKISLAVWLPVLVMAVIAYAVAYKVAYDKAKDKQVERIATVQRCKKTLNDLSQPADKTKDTDMSSKSDLKLADLGKRYGGHFGGGVLDSPPSIDTINYYERCANADTSINHGFLYLPE